MTDTEIGPVNGHVLTKLTPIPPEYIPESRTEQPAPVVEDVPETAAPVAVDNPNLPSPGVTQEKRRPILAPWLKNKPDFLATTKHAGANAGYAALFHGVRLPVYSLRLSLMAPRGACRFIADTNRWVWDREAAPLREAAVRAEDAAEYMTLSRLRANRVRLRGLVTIVAAVFGAGFALWLYVMAPAFLAAFAVGGVLLCGLAGQEKDAPVIGPAVLKTEVQKMTGSIVLRGLDAIGNSRISAAIKKGGDMNGMRFVSEIVRDGPGYRADLDLPYGVTPDDIMEARSPLASGLRRKLGCVWPSPDPDEHEGRLILWVGDKPMNETTKPAWPLLKDGQVDLFKPVVFGNDQRMRDMFVTLMFASVVVGSIPRMGKTFLMRLFLLIAALDPRAEIHAFDFKGTGDFKALEPVCHRYRAGEDPEDIEYVVQALRELKAELRRRAKVIKSLPTSICPESKVTSALASDKRYGLHPIVAGFDECQVPFEDEKYGAEMESICTDLTKRGPALGIVAMFGTQRPDAKSLPPGISANAVLRFALKVMGHTANDMVLGTGAYKAGIRATMFSRSDRGICWMSGEGDDPRIVASAFVDAPRAELVAARARKLREAYGNVTGHAIGQGPEESIGMDVLGDILKVVGPGEEQMWNERIAARLVELRPDVYAGWKAENVTAALKPWGVKTDQVWGQTDDGEGKNRRGIKRADVAAAITRRDADRAAN
ncbi:cell division protein FtsK [Streptomyces sp. ISL-112]|uniref:FtsK/SpoIIIE domain-containing protein n=1 Tax=unclassified Streptomyces TaxID=2593676 RepID=UPI001BEA7167|nr:MULTISPECIES: FtsK/SpoIIIE domain-containing protein [unclassified Streptomyces]MBT2425241.1 cell division protein FtsK [Streptomyces sp. ISL-112]MBT2462032.1 cell division protein FtsK [Streptomyces sp. ISL-63]